MPGRHAAPEPTLAEVVRRWQQTHLTPSLPPEWVGGQAYPVAELLSPWQRASARRLDEGAGR
jgi:hypothetical protein